MKPTPGWTDAFSPHETRAISRHAAAVILRSARRDGRMRRDPHLSRAYYVYGVFGERNHLDCTIFG